MGTARLGGGGAFDNHRITAGYRSVLVNDFDYNIIGGDYTRMPD